MLGGGGGGSEGTEGLNMWLRASFIVADVLVIPLHIYFFECMFSNFFIVNINIFLLAYYLIKVAS